MKEKKAWLASCDVTHFRLPSVIWWKRLKAISCFFFTSRLLLRYVLLLVWAKVTRKKWRHSFILKKVILFPKSDGLLGNRGTRIKQMDFAFYASWNIILFSDEYELQNFFASAMFRILKRTVFDFCFAIICLEIGPN